MSVVAVKRQNDRVRLACDSQITQGYSKFMGKGNISSWSKIFRSNGMLIGAVGLVEEASLFQIFCQNHKPSRNEESGVIEFMEEFYTQCRSRQATFSSQCSYILVIEGKVWSIDGLLVLSVPSFTAIGSGMFLAIGAMEAGVGIETAIEISKKFDLYCGGETVILEQKIKSKKKS